MSSCDDELEGEEIHLEDIPIFLDKIMRSVPFANSKRLQRFLSYLVSEKLAGRGEKIKAYSIGLEVFDRSHDFDAGIDPIVRTTANRLRAALAAYYLESGKDDKILITLPKGKYVPGFQLNEEAHDSPPSLASVSDAVVEDVATPNSPKGIESRQNQPESAGSAPGRRLAMHWVGGMVLVVALAFAAAWYFTEFKPGKMPSEAILVVETTKANSAQLDTIATSVDDRLAPALSSVRLIRVISRTDTQFLNRRSNPGGRWVIAIIRPSF
jgi:hypothetical protein